MVVRALRKISDWLDALSRSLAVPMIAAFFLLILFGVFTRFVLRRPMLGVSDYSKTCFVWSSFLGASVLFKRKEHIAITGFVNLFPMEVKRIIKLLAEFLELVFFVYVMLLGIKVSSMVHVTKMVATGIPISVLYSALPVCMFTCAIHTLASMAERFTTWRNGSVITRKGVTE